MISVLLTHHTLKLEALDSFLVVAKLWKAWVRTAEKAVRGNRADLRSEVLEIFLEDACKRIYNFQIAPEVVKSCLFELGPCRKSDSLLRYTDRRP
jgi:hypothetical protein